MIQDRSHLAYGPVGNQKASCDAVNIVSQQDSIIDSHEWDSKNSPSQDIVFLEAILANFEPTLKMAHFGTEKVG